MIYKPLSAAWKTIGNRAKGALSGTSYTKSQKIGGAATAALGLLGTTAVIKSVSTSKQRQQNLRNRSKSTFRGF